jgi:hypothetical protein
MGKQQTKKKYNKYNNPACDNKMTFEDCELAILRQAVDENEETKGKKIVNTSEIKSILKIVEDFLIKKKLMCYGGTAINNILPTYDQFYNRDAEIPDYDFYSPDALKDAKELTDIYYKLGYTDAEAKAGVHYGTYKVYVNFIPIADITQLEPNLYKSLFKESLLVAGIRYVPANFLRMGMYLELSRPSGDVSRWEKVLKRLTLLNKHYPLKSSKCDSIDFQRKMSVDDDMKSKIYLTARDTLINNGVVFFGGYAYSLYSQYISNKESRSKTRKHTPDFDVLSDDINKTALILQEQLQELGATNIKSVEHAPLGEILPRRIQVAVGDETIAFIYEPIACHNYNVINVKNTSVKVATIDTILSFYLGFTYLNLPEYDADRLLCMSSYLFHVQEKNRLSQKGLLKRFNIDCFGKQPTKESIRAEKASKYREIKKGSKQYEEWFLNYNPANIERLKLEKKEKIEKTKAKKKQLEETKNKTKKKRSKLFPFL